MRGKGIKSSPLPTSTSQSFIYPHMTQHSKIKSAFPLTILCFSIISKQGKKQSIILLSYHNFVTMNDDWDLHAFVKAASSPPTPINNVPPVTSATDYPFGIPVNEDSFDANALFHDHDDSCSSLHEIYQQFYGNTIPPPPQPPSMNNVLATIPVVSQTFHPPQFEPIVPQQPLPQMMIVHQVQGGAVLDKTVQVQGGPSIQPSVASSSRVQPLRQKKRFFLWENDKNIASFVNISIVCSFLVFLSDNLITFF